MRMSKDFVMNVRKRLRKILMELSLRARKPRLGFLEFIKFIVVVIYKGDVFRKHLFDEQIFFIKINKLVEFSHLVTNEIKRFTYFYVLTNRYNLLSKNRNHLNFCNEFYFMNSDMTIAEIE